MDTILTKEIRAEIENLTGLTEVRELLRCKDGLVVLAADPTGRCALMTTYLPYEGMQSKELREYERGWLYPHSMQDTESALTHIDALTNALRLTFCMQGLSSFEGVVTAASNAAQKKANGK